MFHRLMVRAWFVLACAGLLVACGGGDDAAPPPMIGAAGGTVTGPNGAQAVVPAGALAANTAIVVAQSSAGSPALPAGINAFGSMFAFTPHGTSFALPVTITVPFTAASVPAGATPVLYKTNAAGAWEQVAGAAVNAATMTAQVTSFSFLLVGAVPPQITTQPSDQAVTAPATVSFSVVAIGFNPPFTYQWQRSDDAGANFIDIAGATASSYTTGATAVATDNGDRYRVLVSSFGGSSTSAAATLTVTGVIVAPNITTQPQNQTVAAGSNASFTVTATGTNLVYQWQKNGAAIAGATNASLNLVNVQASDAGSYTAVVSNLVNGVPINSVTSSVATLTLTAAPPATTAVRIAAGNNSSSAVTAAGTLYTWGSSRGVGFPEPPPTSAAASIALTNVRTVVRGASTTGVAVRNDGSVWAWGYAGDVVCVFGGSGYDTPTQIAGGAGTAAASAGLSHSLLLSNAGVVSAFGCNGSGQLGVSGIQSASSAVPVPGLPAGIVAVAAGNFFSLALDGNGNVWAWGKLTNFNATTLIDYGFTPVQIVGLSGIKAIAVGDNHALALTMSGAVMAWGSNSNGKLGDGTQAIRLTPVATLLTSGIKAVDASAEFSLALREADGVVLSWGINETGQLGSGSSSPGFRVTPAPVVTLTGVQAIAASKNFSGGIGHGLALKADGTVWAWGWNMQGQLGNGSTSFSTTPVPVTGLNLN